MKFPLRRARRSILVDALEPRCLLAAELVSNGKFANSDTAYDITTKPVIASDWEVTGDLDANARFATAYSGPGYAYLAGSDGTLATSNNLVGTLTQKITFPSNTATANFTFYYRTASAEAIAQADSLAVRIRNTAGSLLQTVTTLYNQNMGAYAQSAAYSLAGYAGQTIVLSFEGQTNATNGTVFRIDDVSVQATASTVPTIPAPTPVYPGVPSASGMPVVNTPSPGFKWNPVAGATGYGLTLEKLNGSTYSVVYDTDTNPTTSGRPIAGTNFTVPLSLAGGTYRWSVHAYGNAVTMTSDAPPLYFTIGTGTYTRALGIDVSSYQMISASAWSTIKTNGTPGDTSDDISFVWAKASQGVDAPDSTYLSKATNARAAGVTIGAYHFGTPWNGGSTLDSMADDAVAEANDFYSRISTTLLPGNLVPMLDFEDTAGHAVTQSVQLLTHWVNAFCDRLTSLTKLTPVIYSGQYYAYAHLSTAALRYPIWIAQYPSDPDVQTQSPSDPDGSGVRTPTTPWPTWQFWQYTDSGPIAGYGSGVDSDVFQGDVAALAPYKIASTTTTTITGTLFNDLNGNGLRETGENGIAGRTVFLDADGDNVQDPGEFTATTNASGTYTFAALAGTYRVRQVVPAGWAQTTPAAATQVVQVVGTGGTVTVAAYGTWIPDVTAPAVTTGRFNFDTAANSITLQLTEAVGTTLVASDATLTLLGTTPMTLPMTLSYNNTTFVATFTPAAPLANGSYTFAIPAGRFTDAAGNANAAYSLDFFSLVGDVNRDRVVGFDDLLALAQNYGITSGATFAQGDLTFDGKVDFDDLLALAQNYGNAALQQATIVATPAAKPKAAARSRASDVIA